MAVAHGKWSPSTKWIVSIITILAMLGLMSAYIYYATQINWYAHATRFNCTTPDDDTAAKCCCPKPSDSTVILDCEAPRAVMHSKFTHFLRWPSYMALFGQVALVVMFIVVVAMYVPGGHHTSSATDKQPSKGLGSKASITIMLLGFTFIYITGWGTFMSLAYTSMQHDEWPTYWGRNVGPTNIYNEVNNGTANCFYEWRNPDTYESGKTGPVNLKSLSIGISISWAVEAMLFVLVVIYIYMLSHWYSKWISSEKSHRSATSSLDVDQQFMHSHDVSIPGAHARARHVPERDLVI